MTTASNSRSLSAGAGALGAVPTAVWAYALLRSLAFLAPTWTEGGQIGFGVVVVGVLFVQLIRRRSHRIWQVLVFVDLFSASLMVMVWATNRSMPVAAPVLAVGAVAVLVVPPVRRFVEK